VFHCQVCGRKWQTTSYEDMQVDKCRKCGNLVEPKEVWEMHETTMPVFYRGPRPSL
jgi:NAD-dependent SIR2 family protein deacetylase